MRKILFLATIGIILSLSSCSNDQESTHSSESSNNTYGIELVKGEKWEVNKEMMVHIKNMETDIQSISSQSDPNFKELGSKLDDRIELLTSNCTMTGKAHDELHKWLLPFIGLVKELNEAASIEKQRHSFEALQESMDEFNTYFK